MRDAVERSTFVFITDEGYTYQPMSEAIEPDVENLQVLGFGDGSDASEAFEDLLREAPWLREMQFSRTWCYRLAPGARREPVEFCLTSCRA